MSMDESRFRDALRSSADQVEPGPDGWERIQTKVAVARRRRRVGTGVLSAAAVVVVALVAVALVSDDNEQDVESGPVATDPTVPETTTPPTTPTEGGWFSYDSPAVWSRSFDDPVEAARSFMREYVGMPSPVAGEFRAGDNRSGEVEVRPRAGLTALTTTVFVRQLDGDRWSVTGSASQNIELESPDPMDEISWPVTVSGRARAFEGHVNVEVREDGMLAGQSLGEGFVTGSGSEDLGPFEDDIQFSTPSKPAGTIVLYTASAEDGSIQEATVVRVRFAATATQIAAVQDEQVVLLDADGNHLRSLTFGQQGVRYQEVVADGASVVALRELEGPLTIEIVRIPTGEGDEEVLVTEGIGAHLALSNDGRRVAYARGHTLVIRDLAAGTERTWTWEGNGAVTIGPPAWSPDGSAVALGLSPEGSSDSRVRLLDLAADASLDQATVIGEYNAPTYRGRFGTLVVADGTRIVAMDEQGNEVAPLLQASGPVTMIDADESGRHLLYLTEDGTLWRWSGGVPVRLGRGYTDADW